MSKNKNNKGANPNKIEPITVEKCVVLEAMGGDKFKVKLPNEHEMICHISGKIRKNHIRILPYDVVTIELSPFDVLNNGRIVFREKGN